MQPPLNHSILNKLCRHCPQQQSFIVNLWRANNSLVDTLLDYTLELKTPYTWVAKRDQAISEQKKKSFLMTSFHDAGGCYTVC